MNIPKTTFRILAQISIAGACLFWALRDIQWHSMLDAISSYGILRPGATFAYVVAITLPQGVRLAMLARGGFSVATGISATFLGLALNMILPAKLGEVAKTLYLSRRGASLSESTGIVFWERFLDVNMLLGCAMVVSFTLDLPLALTPLALFTCLLWGFAALGICNAPILSSIIAMVPMVAVRDFMKDTLDHIKGATAIRGRILSLAGMTTIIWTSAAGLSFLVCNWLAGFGLTAIQVLTVFVVSAIGISIPATPAGLGIFEVAVSSTLQGFGIPPENALTATIALHLLQVIPQLLIGVCVLGLNGFGLLRQAREPARD